MVRYGSLKPGPPSKHHPPSRRREGGSPRTHTGCVTRNGSATRSGGWTVPARYSLGHAALNMVRIHTEGTIRRYRTGRKT
jgi:hypothetical protein